jgi:subtilisin family serine protease
VDVTAPGVDIVSLGVHGLAYRSGTSMAAAYVSATLALEAAAAPRLSTAALRDVLVRTARAGAVDAARAVGAATHRVAR